MSKVWQVQEAKARFSELLATSLAEGPQIVTKRGVETAVLVPIDQWRRLERMTRPTLKELLLAPEPRTEDHLHRRVNRSDAAPPRNSTSACISSIPTSSPNCGARVQARPCWTGFSVRRPITSICQPSRSARSRPVSKSPASRTPPRRINSRRGSIIVLADPRSAGGRRPRLSNLGQAHTRPVRHPHAGRPHRRRRHRPPPNRRHPQHPRLPELRRPNPQPLH